MALERILKRSGQAVPVPGDDLDTDRIIPARFMKCITFDGLGEFLFYDVRKTADGSDTDHNLNKPEYADASIIISGNNFGCGSSREHAPQAIAKAGFQAVIAEGYAEIFFGNSTQLGIPCVTVSYEDRIKLAESVTADPGQEITIDLEKECVLYVDGKLPFSMRSSSRQSLIDGNWDPLQELIDNKSMVDAVAGSLSYVD
ncbi:MAG: 3-isopropylmalate dehydratase small subunit [Bacteroidetes bacterium]|nr:3-isopropylmalate dehydratase small subunit [Bacteroidota bacterium]